METPTDKSWRVAKEKEFIEMINRWIDDRDDNQININTWMRLMVNVIYLAEEANDE